MKHIVSILLFSVILAACSSNEPAEEVNQKATQPEIQLNSHLSIFEIPVTDMTRAIKFYEELLGIKIEPMKMEGFQMGIFPYENQVINGLLIKGEGYVPSANGVTIYLNVGEDLQVSLDRMNKDTGTVLMPKTAHGDGSGYFSLILDSEGNKIGLHSTN